MRMPAVIIASSIVLAPVALAQTPAQLIVGAWECSAPVGNMISSGPIVYNADGTSTFDQLVSGPMEGMMVKVRVVGEATWEIEPNGQLTDRIKDAEAVEGTVDDAPLPKSILSAFAAELKAIGVSTSTFTVNPTDLFISDGAGGGTTCKR